ncbi:histone-like nucleoid-structuring protein MvaT [Pseudomonas neustonica]|uniref:H-NS histone n=1 Tax=Pseudomonas neustonica TaxID=2487346 RepID=A0ABX9XN17_9PSED|nr:MULTISPECIES: histone-like nucleoid-structuring protein MvaT [Pseudomonas]MBA6419247.1 DNA binding protein [Pseudomonas sp. 5Ae-yellow]ROZ86978.1 H-NS histone [Pseudomonas sp. SSM44]ROZ88406.1 H-NS histone [Pseudomonas neustonica]|tara:strand:+ start:17782 stop:18150 length:369 start_codon:yes stop_codon:yes gene_type:complete
MSMLQEYRQIEETIRELNERLQSLSNDDKLKKEIEFEEKLRTLMGQYNKSLKDVVSILDPDNKAGTGKKAAGGVKRARKVKQYKNPNTGEVIETKGGNHKTLKAWKEQYGSEKVESWMTILG